MRVYRVEDAKRGGPYLGMNMIYSMAVKHSDDREDREDLVCGSATLKQYRDWFDTKDKKDLKRKFKLSVYQIPKEHVYRGKFQIVFNRKKAKRLERRPIL